jgi:hypothetical protein
MTATARSAITDAIETVVFRGHGAPPLEKSRALPRGATVYAASIFDKTPLYAISTSG